MATLLNVVSLTHLGKGRVHISNSFAMCQESHERDVAESSIESILCQQSSAKEQHDFKQ